MKKILLLIAAVSFLSFPQDIKNAKALLQNESYEKAKTELQKINSAEASYYLGELYVKIGNLDSASIAYNKGITLDSKNPLNFAGLAKVNFFKNNSAEAEKNLNMARELSDEKNVNGYIAIADAYIKAPTPAADKAQEALDAALKIDKKNADVYMKLGELNLARNNSSEAVANFQKAMDLNSNLLDAYLRKAEIYTNVKNYSEAESTYIDVEKLNPDYAPTYRMLAEFYFDQEQFDKAVENYKKYVSLSEESSNNLKQEVLYLYSARNYEDAITLIKRILAAEPNNIKMQQYLAYSYSQLKTPAPESKVKYPQEAIAAFEKYLSDNNGKTDYAEIDYELYGKLLLENGNDSLAAINLKKALALDTSKTELHNLLATVYFKARNWKNVVEEYTAIRNSKGTLNAQELFDLGRAFYFDSSYQQADTTFAQFIQTMPEFAYGYSWRARIQSSFDPESEQGLAKPYYEKFIELASADTSGKFKRELIEAYSYLGYYYYVKKDMSTSRQNWLKVKELDPENVQATEALKVLK